MRDEPTSLSECFDALARALRQMIALLEESGDTFWIAYLKRGLAQVEKRHLGGATFILGCYGGADTFSDTRIGAALKHSSPLDYRNLNARFEALRNDIFSLADAIASRRHW